MMVTWVLVEEPNVSVQRAIELIEDRVGSTSEVMWISPGELVEPVE